MRRRGVQVWAQLVVDGGLAQVDDDQPGELRLAVGGILPVRDHLGCGPFGLRPVEQGSRRDHHRARHQLVAMHPQQLGDLLRVGFHGTVALRVVLVDDGGGDGVEEATMSGGVLFDPEHHLAGFRLADGVEHVVGPFGAVRVDDFGGEQRGGVVEDEHVTGADPVVGGQRARRGVRGSDQHRYGHRVRTGLGRRVRQFLQPVSDPGRHSDRHREDFVRAGRQGFDQPYGV
ncbi:hypothetical protein [Solwaraspora sp. WMMA2101]|uniref:hypothetical protein n=1 Tax=Solwaraspora sp. WMMA2101 TaxID=3404124 RepID=UPI003B959CFD